MGKFRESELAHRLLDGLDSGLEIGGSAHNSFGLKNFLNVDYTAEHTGHKQAEIDLCGEKLPVDVVAEGDCLPFENDRFDFVLSSHSLEHMPDMLSALVEWHRVVRDGGLLYIVYPRRDDNPDDRQYAYTTHDHILDDFATKQTVATHPCLPGQGPRGHYHMLTLESFVELIGKFFEGGLEVISTLEHDDKVGNGHTTVVRVHKTPLITSYYRKVDLAL